MSNGELLDRSRQLAREELDAIRWEALNVPLSDETKNNYEPLLCWVCEEDLLGARLGNVVWAKNSDQVVTPRYTDVFWVCKGGCDKVMQAALHVLKYSSPWADVKDLKNPLEHKRWAEVTSRQIERGEISETAAAKISELLRITAPLADREPTPEDLARFQQILDLRSL
ncbi:MAG TPA: hypothetical protein VNA27_06165 [Rubrobacteraceae bacterium]|nr:hypothetical protein [Rubrobacteraceae bacterium]